MDTPIVKEYKCGWCQWIFERAVRVGSVDKQRVSDQVKCPKCNNFLKTWD